MRLFVAVDLPDRLADAIETAQDRLRDADGLRFTDPGNAHVTLQFLGETDPDRREAVAAAVERGVEAAGVGPFDCAVGGLGVFPDLGYISVVWAGIQEGGPDLAALHDAVVEETAALGFSDEDHDFTPHVTLARMDDTRGKELVRRMVEGTDPMVGRFRVEEVRLKWSRLTDDGPEYDTVATADL